MHHFLLGVVVLNRHYSKNTGTDMEVFNTGFQKGKGGG